MAQIEGDSLALKRLKNRDGETFEGWCAKHEAERRRYEAAVLQGYPPPEMAAASAQKWEAWLAYAQQQRAVGRAFRTRALNVCRVILAKRGVRATEAEAEARTWEQAEEVERWEALVATLNEWLWQGRALERSFQDNAAPRKK